MGNKINTLADKNQREVWQKMDNKKIVIADDEMYIRLLVKSALGKDYTVLEASDGEEAINITEMIVAGLEDETPGADANEDGDVDIFDITYLEMIVAGLV